MRVEFLKALAHPLRLRVVDRLGHRGPAPVSQLAAELDATLPELSNGLRQLRDAGIVVASRTGRTVIYELADDRVPALLDKLVGPPAAAPARAPSRTCYDHLAGPLGVDLYGALVARGAILPAADGTVSLGDPAPLRALGVGEIEPGRRRLAFECLDATEHAPHLAGALGDAVAAALLAHGWVERGAGREIRVTATGADRLRSVLGVVET